VLQSSQQALQENKKPTQAFDFSKRKKKEKRIKIINEKQKKEKKKGIMCH
jgi:hypothetical protein